MRFFSLDAGQNRTFGLDLLRFFAIGYVILGHSSILLPDNFDPTIRKIVLDGVSIFFVLSGFLIGRILLKMIQQGKFALIDLWHFWSRRWMRTLPAYLMVLIFLVIYTGVLKPARLPDDFYRYFLFIQNFWNIQPLFFSESWSLSIEEWFYLLIPILFFSLAKIFPKKRNSMILSGIIAVIISVICYRIYLFDLIENPTQKMIDSGILRQVLCRLDAIMFGVLGAFVSMHYQKTWLVLNHWWVFVLCFILLYVLKERNATFDTIYYTGFHPAFKSISVLLMLPYLSQMKLKKENLITRFITFTSLISYSLYLVNRTIVIDILIKYGLHDNLKKRHIVEINWFWDYMLFFIFSFALSFILYKLIEQPFLKLRDRLIQ